MNVDQYLREMKKQKSRAQYEKQKLEQELQNEKCLNERELEERNEKHPDRKKETKISKEFEYMLPKSRTQYEKEKLKLEQQKENWRKKSEEQKKLELEEREKRRKEWDEHIQRTQERVLRQRKEKVKLERQTDIQIQQFIKERDLKEKLEQEETNQETRENQNSRYIPSHIRREVWRRDQGKCVNCGSRKKLEYDHIIPFSEGGSNTVRNIELLCEECNRKKSNNIG